MIKNISELKKKPLSFIKDFIQNCTIEEKIDAYYVSIEIQSKTSFVMYKANGQQVSRTDTILNEMWSWLINDWTWLRRVNEDWFNNHIGYRIYMFYFPSDKPILTKYREDVCYLIDRIEYNEVVIDEPYYEMENMEMLDKFRIKFKDTLQKNYDINDVLSKIETESFDKLFKSIIDFEHSVIYAVDEPEGYILKWGKKHIYQIQSNRKQNRVASADKSAYEYLLLNFIKFWKNNDMVNRIDRHSYDMTVCNFFNSYIMSYEKETGVLDRNIDSDSIESPCIGHRFDLCYNNIPNDTTIQLCKENTLYKNIFKVLLVNLKRKKLYKQCVLMSQKNIDDWNEIVQTISNLA